MCVFTPFVMILTSPAWRIAGIVKNVQNKLIIISMLAGENNKKWVYQQSF